MDNFSSRLQLSFKQCTEINWLAMDYEWLILSLGVFQVSNLAVSSCIKKSKYKKNLISAFEHTIAKT
jgi:hypothetical protein